MQREGRAGNKSVRVSHFKTMVGPDPKSKRSQRRKNRGFVSLEQSSRKHRRARNRSYYSRFQYGAAHEAGKKVDGGSGTFVHSAGGSLKYH